MSASIHSIRIVADDLSGAADCAAAFARVAGPVPVWLGAGQGNGCDVESWPACTAIDTDSRTMDSGAAAMATVRAFELLARAGVKPGLIYKKIDSTLRGHVAVELEAALRSVPHFAGALVAPAFPQQGRTLVGGRLRVQGRPADNLGHSGDLMAMLDTPALRPQLLGATAQDPRSIVLRIETMLAGGAHVIVADAGSDEDLACLAAALCSPGAPHLLVAGSAGLARALAAHVELPGVAGHDARAALATARAALVIVGSFSKASAAQVDQLEASGDAQVFRLDAGQWLGDACAAARRGAVAAAGERLRRGGHVVIAIAGDVVQPFSPALVQAMARTAAPLLALAGACVLTGGDTARALFDELGVTRLDVLGEFEPGISIARAPPVLAAPLVLKAGGFGDALALQRIVRHVGPHLLPSQARRGAAT